MARQSFTAGQLRRLRQLVTWAARRVGLNSDRRYGLVLAVSEAAANVIEHGGGTGQLELIKDDGRALIARISDHGSGIPLNTPHAVPAPEQSSGRGLYLMEQTCDRVEYRIRPDGTTVDLEMDLDNR